MIIVFILIILFITIVNSYKIVVYEPLEKCNDGISSMNSALIHSTINVDHYVYGVNDDCYNCLPMLLTLNGLKCFSIYTSYPWTLLLKDDHNNTLYSTSFQFNEQGEYLLESNDNKLTIKQLKEGIHISFMTILILIIAVAFLILYSKIVTFFSKGKDNTNRIVSLDSYRGMISSLMILVNYGGGNFYFLNHSTWNGITIADVLFPSFVFISGFSMSYTLDKVLHDETKAKDIWFQIIKRTILLYALNLFVNNGFNINTVWRYPGVLFYHAVSGLVTSITVIMLRNKTRSLMTWSKDTSLLSFLSIYMFEYIIQGAIILITMSLSLGVKLDNCPRGYQGAGGLSDNGLYPHCTGGMHRVIDVLVFGDKHIYDNPTFQNMYQSYDRYDPEGLLGSISACTLCYVGLVCGRIFHFYKNNIRMQLKVFRQYQSL